MKFGAIFLTIVILEIITAFSIQYLFVGEQLYYQSFGEQLTLERIDLMLELTKKYQWLNYTLIPVIILLRVFYTSVFLFIGVFFSELEIEFGKLFKIALLTEFIYVVAGVAKLAILIFFKQVNTLEDLQFQSLSVIELIDNKNVDMLFIYPLSLLNVFELGYFLVLAWLLVGVINEANEERPVKYGKSLQIVTVSYGSGLLLWVVLVMFLTLNMS